MLDLHDFPGQGTALVGVLEAPLKFMYQQLTDRRTKGQLARPLSAVAVEIPRDRLLAVLHRYRGLVYQDGRHQIWVRGLMGEQIVLEEIGMIYVYPDDPLFREVLEGEGAIAKNREIMGATNPANAAAGTIRKDFAESIEANSVHGSDSPENAAIEIAYFFPGLGKLLGWVLLSMLLFGMYGLYRGQLQNWLDTVAWETGPEHWHGNYDWNTLFSRIPSFYLLWLQYSGGCLFWALLALARNRQNPRSRGTKAALGGALSYSFLLCTIDHQPSHYFLPLLHLSVIALLILGEFWMVLGGATGLLLFYLYGNVV